MSRHVSETERSLFNIVDDHILRFFTDLVRDLGGDPKSILRAAGVDPQAFSAGRVPTTYDLMVELVGRAAVGLRCSDFGMRLAHRQMGHIKSPLTIMMENCANVREALRQASAYCYAHSPAAAIWLDVSPEDDRVLVGHDILLSGMSQCTQAIEQILLTANYSIRAISGGGVRARRVHFRHQPVSALAVYRRYFGCNVVFESEHNALVLDARDLSLPIMRADRGLFEATVSSIHGPSFQRSPFHARVRALIIRHLGGGGCRSEPIAKALGIDVRTMHRQLWEDATSFQLIKTDVRRELALFYLEQTDLALSTISQRLGFSEQSALAYFCRKWMSRAPSAIRRDAAIVRNEQV